MFERFNEAARRSLFFARFEASALGSDAMVPEHLLLGLLRAHDSATRRLLGGAGLTYGAARAEIEARLGRRPYLAPSVEIPFSGPLKALLESAVKEADRLEHRIIAPAHLLLSLLQEEGSFACELLRKCSLSSEAVLGHLAEPARASELSTPTALGERRSSESASTPRGFEAHHALEELRLFAQLLARSKEESEKAQLLQQIHATIDALTQHPDW